MNNCSLLRFNQDQLLENKMNCNNSSLAKYVQITDTPDGVKLPVRLYENYLKKMLNSNFIDYTIKGDDIYIQGTTADFLRELHISAYDAKYWYEPLKEFTFSSVFVNLNLERSQFIIEYDKDKNLINTRIGSELIEELQRAFDQICTLKNSKLFVKLESVSPKDLWDGDSDAMAAYRPEHVISMLAKSKRVLSELKVNPNCSIMLREFRDDLPWENEWRCFVSNRKLRAISQYHWTTARYDLYENRYVYRSKLEKFFEQIIPLLPWPDAVVDVVFNMDLTQCYVIECNCFGAELIAGSALFNWDSDHDILYGNNGRPLIRINDGSLDIF